MAMTLHLAVIGPQLNSSIAVSDVVPPTILLPCVFTENPSGAVSPKKLAFANGTVK